MAIGPRDKGKEATTATGAYFLSELGADRRTKIEATLAQMKVDASTAEANFQKLT